MKYIFILFLSFNAVWGYSQTVNQFNTWYDYAGNHTLSENYKLHTLYSFRRSGLIQDWQQSLLRVGLTRSLGNNVSVMLGYDNAITFPYGEYPIAEQTTEHRSIERLNISQKIFNNVGLTHRYQLEQRYVSGQDTKHRVRYRLTANIPLKSYEQGQQLYVAAFNEVFINLGSAALPHVFDQNWWSLGLGFKFNNNTGVKMAYMDQYFVKGDNIRVENNHTLLLGLTHNFDLRTNKM